MFEVVQTLHKALGIERTWPFVLVVALCTAVIFGTAGGFCAWIVDKAYKNSPEYRESVLASATEPSATGPASPQLSSDRIGQSPATGSEPSGNAGKSLSHNSVAGSPGLPPQSQRLTSQAQPPTQLPPQCGLDSDDGLIRNAGRMTDTHIDNVYVAPSPDGCTDLINNEFSGTMSGTTINGVYYGTPFPKSQRLILAIETVQSFSSAGEKFVRLHITTDQPITGVLIGFVFSGPIETDDTGELIDKPILNGVSTTQLNSSSPIYDQEAAVPNSIYIAIKLPFVFSPGQELIVPVRSKVDVQVLKWGAKIADH